MASRLQDVARNAVRYGRYTWVSAGAQARKGDMVIWDNRSVMHQANADYDMKESRRLYRIMIRGELHPSDISATQNVRLETEQRLPA